MRRLTTSTCFSPVTVPSILCQGKFSWPPAADRRTRSPTAACLPQLLDGWTGPPASNTPTHKVTAAERLSPFSRRLLQLTHGRRVPTRDGRLVPMRGVRVENASLSSNKPQMTQRDRQDVRVYPSRAVPSSSSPTTTESFGEAPRGLAETDASVVESGRRRTSRSCVDGA